MTTSCGHYKEDERRGEEDDKTFYKVNDLSLRGRFSGIRVGLVTMLT